MSVLEESFGMSKLDAMQGGMRVILCWSVWGSFFFSLAACFATRAAKAQRADGDIESGEGEDRKLAASDSMKTMNNGSPRPAKRASIQELRYELSRQRAQTVGGLF